MLHSNHQHLVSPESANGCTERLTHVRTEAARAFGVGGCLRSNRRQNALGCLWLDLEYTKPVLIVGASTGTVVPWTGTSACIVQLPTAKCISWMEVKTNFKNNPKKGI